MQKPFAMIGGLGQFGVKVIPTEEWSRKPPGKA